MNQSDVMSFDEFVGYNRTGGGHHDPFRLGLEVQKRARYPLAPTWALMSYFTCVNAIGIIVNLSLCLRYVLDKNKKGIKTLIFQMAISDLLTLTVVSIPELTSHQSGDWTFGVTMCRLYSSFEVLSTTSEVYFLIAISLHALALANLVAKGKPTARKGLDDDLLEDPAELRSSQRSLVSRGETLTTGRQLTLGRRKKEPSVPVVLPLIFVWILSAALSIPELPLSHVVDARSGVSMCTFLTGYHLTTMRIILSAFQLIVPLIILSCTSGLIVYKLLKTDRDCGEASNGLRLSLFMCCVFLVFSLPRMLLAFVFSFWNDKKDIAIGYERFMSPPLNFSMEPIWLPTILGVMHFITPIIRPMGYAYFLNRSDMKISWFNKKNQSDNLNRLAL